MTAHQGLKPQCVLLSQTVGIPRPCDVQVVHRTATPPGTFRAGSVDGGGGVSTVHMDGLGMRANGELVGLNVTFPQVVAGLVYYRGLRTGGRKCKQERVEGVPVPAGVR